MAEDKNMEEHFAEMDYEAHDETYGKFLGLLKWGTILSAIVVIIVLIAIT